MARRKQLEVDHFGKSWSEPDRVDQKAVEAQRDQDWDNAINTIVCLIIITVILAGLATLLDALAAQAGLSQ